MNITIRPIEDADLRRCAEVFALTFRAAPYNDQWTTEAAERKLAMLRDRGPRYAPCAEVDGEIVGAAFARESAWWAGKCVVIEELFVHPQAQGLGAGRALLNEIETRAKAQGAIGMWLLANREANAFTFYRRAGFREIREVAVMAKLFPEAP